MSPTQLNASFSVHLPTAALVPQTQRATPSDLQVFPRREVRVVYSASMSDESQIEIPPSFMELYLAPGRQKPSVSRAELAARYELCEDMAQMLTETARNMEFSLGITEADVLARCQQGLQVEPTVVSEAESVWVVRRLAELLDWRMPEEKRDNGVP